MNNLGSAIQIFWMKAVLMVELEYLVRLNKPDFLNLFLGNVFQKHKDSGADITISCVPMDDR